MDNLVLKFYTLNIKRINFINFYLQNNLQIIMILTLFIQIWTFGFIKKICVKRFPIFLVAISVTYNELFIKFSRVFEPSYFFYRYLKKKKKTKKNWKFKLFIKKWKNFKILRKRYHV
jgi:hypothetical protein